MHDIMKYFVFIHNVVVLELYSLYCCADDEIPNLIIEDDVGYQFETADWSKEETGTVAAKSDVSQYFSNCFEYVRKRLLVYEQDISKRFH